MQRINKPATFLDSATADLGGPRTSQLLAKLATAIDWDRAAAVVAELAEYRRTGAGRRPWDAGLMVRCMMLQRWFNLSDPQLEEQLKDRLSFRRFAGLSLEDATPDETTFVVFRRRLRQAGLEEAIFEQVLGQLAARGLLVKQGTIVDATIIEQSRGRKRPDGTSTRDGEASYTRKHGRTYHGYKAHVASDAGGLIVGCVLTTARMHDSTQIDQLTEGEEKAVLADSAYSSEARRRELRGRGVIDGICYKRSRGQKKLYDWQARWNKLVARLRAAGERPFAFLKHHMGWRRVRYRGEVRNRADLWLRSTAYNIKWSLSLAG
jgi:transposase, IS5 family